MSTSARRNPTVRARLPAPPEPNAPAPPAGTLLPDLAAETSGGRVVAPLSSSAYRPPGEHWLARLLPALLAARPPRVALSADNSFGNCWAFAGTEGRLAVRLRQPAAPTHFSVCHLARAYQADRSSAPALVQVYGLPDAARPADAVLLASHRYDADGPDCQTFAAAAALDTPTRLFQFRFAGNHGKPDYTCIYQVRVHSAHV